MSVAIEAARSVGLLLETDDFAVLLACLPDAFFDLDEAGQTNVWREIRRGILAGERDLERLGEAAIPYIEHSTENPGRLFLGG